MSYLLRRVLAAAVTMLVIVTANFFLFRAAPGDPVSRLAAGGQITQSQQDNLRRLKGYDRSLPEQYVDYMSQLAHGNLGTSTTKLKPVSEIVRADLLRSLPMAAMGVLVAVVLGFLIGEIAAFYRGSPRDHVGMGASVFLYSLPAQWVGLLMLFAFAGVLPSGGMRDVFLVDAGFLERANDYLRHLTLPVLTLAIALVGQFALITRATFLDTLSQDYVLTARAKGLRAKSVLRRHARRNATLPVIALTAVTVGQIAGGAVLVETVFSWPGIGYETSVAISDRDYPLLQGIFLVFAAGVIVCNLLGDLLLAKLDPRVRQ